MCLGLNGPQKVGESGGSIQNVLAADDFISSVKAFYYDRYRSFELDLSVHYYAHK